MFFSAMNKPIKPAKTKQAIIINLMFDCVDEFSFSGSITSSSGEGSSIGGIKVKGFGWLEIVNGITSLSFT